MFSRIFLPVILRTRGGIKMTQKRNKLPENLSLKADQQEEFESKVKDIKKKVSNICFMVIFCHQSGILFVFQF